MRRTDPRYFIIAALLVIAGALAYYRMHHMPAESSGAPGQGLFSEPPEAPSADRVRSMIDTTVKMLGAPRRFISKRTVVDSGRVVPELAVGVPGSFDELRLIRALTDSLRVSGYSVAAQKSLKEKTTVIRLSDRSHQCMYRCLLYRKELSH